MPGLFDPRNCLAMLLQHEARKAGEQLDNMTLSFTVTSMSDGHITGNISES